MARLMIWHGSNGEEVEKDLAGRWNWNSNANLSTIGQRLAITADDGSSQTLRFMVNSKIRFVRVFYATSNTLFY